MCHPRLTLGSAMLQPPWFLRSTSQMGVPRWDDEQQVHRHPLGITSGCWVRELPLPCHCPCASLVPRGLDKHP